MSQWLQGLVVFKIDGDDWTLDLREGAGTVKKGGPAEKPDLTLTISDDNFSKLVMGKLSPQQVSAIVERLAGSSLYLYYVLQPHVRPVFSDIEENGLGTV